MGRARWWSGVPLRLRALVRRADVERELDDEIRDHLDRQTAANVAAGMRPDQARRAALVAFGGVERIKDESRDVRGLSWIDAVARLGLAARSLRRAPTFAVATIATVALAVGAGGAVFTILNGVLLRPLPFPDAGRLVGLWHTAPGIGLALLEQSPGTYLSYREAARSFESIGAYGGGMATVARADPALAPERVPVSWVTASLLRTLGARPLAGRLLTEADEEAPGEGQTRLVALLSERYWRARFGADPGVIGRTLRVEGIPTEIVGVLPASFAFPGSDVRLWVPFTMPRGKYLGSFTFRAVGRLRPGVTPDAAQRELQRILLRTPETYPEQRAGIPTVSMLSSTRLAAVVHPMRDDAIGGIARVLWLVAATVGVLVLVAFSNLASLTLARVEARQRELAIRATLGASRARVWWGLAAESAIVSLAGGAAGVGIGLAALAYVAHLGPTAMPDPLVGGNAQAVIPRLDEIHPDRAFALATLALTAACCVVSASIGSWRLRSADAARLLRAGGALGARGGTASRASQRLRALFVAAEVALSLVLLSGSAVLGHSVLRLRAVRPGFDPADVLTVWTSPPPWRYRTPIDVSRFYRDALDAVGRVPGVREVGVVSKLPLSGWWAASAAFVDEAPRTEGALPPIVAGAAASSGYFGAMGIPLIAGRAFDDEAARHGAAEAVVTRGFATLLWNDPTGRRALGRRVRKDPNGPWYTIVGVVGDVRDTSLTAPATSAVYFPEETGADSLLAYPRGTRDMALVVRVRASAAGAASTTAAIERAIRSLDPAVPVYDAATMTERVALASRHTTFALLLLAAGSAATLALGVVGLYGVIAYVVGLRAREIGIRIALGLAPARAARMILGQGEAIVVAGAAIGLLAFLAFAKLLRSLAFEVSVVDVPSIAAASSIVLLVATLATWLPARRAARIDPAETLRGEG